MRYIMLALIIMCTSSIVMADNTFIKDCMMNYQSKNFDNYNYAKAAACVQKYRTQEQTIEVAEMREFLKRKILSCKTFKMKTFQKRKNLQTKLEM